MPEYRLTRAAQLVGVSDDTVRRWAEQGRVPTSRDAHGHRVVSGADLAALAVELAAGSSAGDPERTSRVSVRNALPGLVTRVLRGDVMAQVDVQAGPHRVVALISREAVDELGLDVGDEVVAAVKATNVSVERP